VPADFIWRGFMTVRVDQIMALIVSGNLARIPNRYRIATATSPRSRTATSTNGSSSSGGDSTPLFALLICLAFGSLGLLAVEAQRRSIRR
jgi:hypothetical protein